MNYIKIKNFCSSEDIIKRVKEDTFPPQYIQSNNGSYSEYIKELLKISEKKDNPLDIHQMAKMKQI